MEHYIVFEGPLDAPHVTDLANAILDASKDNRISKINIFLSSRGGSTYLGFALATIIQNSKIPVSTHATNHVDSIANVVFLAAKLENRTSESHSKFFVHGATREGNNDERGLGETLSALQAENHRIATFISENSRLDLDKVKKKMKNGDTMSAREALEYGFTEQLVHKSIPADASRHDIITLDQI